MILLGGPYDQKLLDRTGLRRGDYLRVINGNDNEVYRIESPDVARWVEDGQDEDTAWADFAESLISRRPDFPRGPK